MGSREGAGREQEKEDNQGTHLKVFLHRPQLSVLLFPFLDLFVWEEGLYSQTVSKEHLLEALGGQPSFSHLRLLLLTLSYLAFRQWTLTLFVFLLPNYTVFICMHLGESSGSTQEGWTERHRNMLDSVGEHGKLSLDCLSVGTLWQQSISALIPTIC